MALQAYKVEQVLVFATRGTEAKMLAAPLIRPMEEWREDVARAAEGHACQYYRFYEHGPHLHP